MMNEILFEVKRPCLAFKNGVHTDFMKSEFQHTEGRVAVTEPLFTHDVLLLVESRKPVEAHGTHYMPCLFNEGDTTIYWVPRDSVEVVVQ
jgi:hypothetical protein